MNTEHRLVVVGGRGTVVLDGFSFSTRTELSGTFTAEDVLVVQNVGGVYQSPFTFSGVANYGGLTAPSGPTDNIPITGQGIMSVFLAGTPNGLVTTGVQFKFLDAAASPTPEPASPLLLGSGVAFLYRRSRTLKSAA